MHPRDIPDLITRAQSLLRGARAAPWEEYVQRANEARHLLEDALELEPDNLDALFALADDYYRKTESYYDAAVEIHKKIATIAPDDPAVLMKISDRFGHANDPVLICLDRILRLNPDDPSIWLQAAAEYAWLDQPSKEAHCLDRIIQLQPADARMWFETLDAYRRIGLITQQHEICLEKCRSLAGDDRDLWTDIYHHLKAIGRREEAELIPTSKLTFKISASLNDFIKTGHLGPIHLGMTRNEVIEVLGEPEGRGGAYSVESDWVYPEKLMDAPIWVYGAIELYFDQKYHRLYMIFTDHMKEIQ